jgi:hypothetical protein
MNSEQIEKLNDKINNLEDMFSKVLTKVDNICNEIEVIKGKQDHLSAAILSKQKSKSFTK